MRRTRQMTQGILVTAIGWTLLALLAFWRDARWPQGLDAWYTFGVVTFAIEFLLLQSWLMLVRAWVLTRLTGALLATYLAFAVNFCWFFVLANLWPSVRRQGWTDSVRHALLTLLALAILWGLVEFWRVPDPPDDGGAPP